MSKFTGISAKVFYKTDLADLTVALTAVPSANWTEMTTIVEVNKADDKESTDASDRHSVVDQELSTGRKLSYELVIDADITDTNYTNLLAAYQTDDLLPLLFTFGALAATTNIARAGNWSIKSHRENEPRKGVVRATFTVAPASFFSDIRDLT